MRPRRAATRMRPHEVVFSFNVSEKEVGTFVSVLRSQANGLLKEFDDVIHVSTLFVMPSSSSSAPIRVLSPSLRMLPVPPSATLFRAV